MLAQIFGTLLGILWLVWSIIMTVGKFCFFVAIAWFGFKLITGLF